MSKTQTISERASVTGEKSGGLYDRTIAATRVLIDGLVSETKLKPKEGSSEERIILSQRAMVVGGERTLNFAVRMFCNPSNVGEKRQMMRKEGCYVFASDALRLNKFGDPELSTFSDAYVFVRDMRADEKTLFAGVRTDAQELLG